MKLFIIVLLLFSGDIAQGQTRPRTEEFSFGKYWYLDYKDKNGNLDIVEKTYRDSGIVFVDSLFYKRSGYINQDLLHKLIYAKELNNVILADLSLDAIGIIDSNYSRTFQINHVIINNGILLIYSKFVKWFCISDCDINGEVIIPDNVVFNSGVSFYASRFNKSSNWTNIVSFGSIDFRGIISKEQFGLWGCEFYSNVYFDNAKFENITIINSNFTRRFNFSNVHVKGKFHFSRNIIRDTLDMYLCNFENGVDLRRNNFDSVKSFIFEGLEYPDGQLFVNWDQIKGNDNPRIALNEFSSDNYDDFRRIELIYEKLRDNYLAQGNKSDADNVMYELAVYKNILIPTFFQRLHGIFLGYGYKPWRFLALAVLPILMIFAFVWYYCYYENIVHILSAGEIKGNDWGSDLSRIFKTRKKKLLGAIIPIYDHNTIKKEINNITRFWHVIYFSGSVLLSIRFKKDWIRLAPNSTNGQKSFLWVISLEWAIGIILYIIFMFYILSYQFASFRGILGF